MRTEPSGDQAAGSSPPDAPEASFGRRLNTDSTDRIGQYRILGELGEGGMGSVLLAFDETLRREVALKSLHWHKNGSPDKARLLREARLLSQLRDPRICQIYDYVETPGADYLVLEKVEGRTLEDFLKSGIDRSTGLSLAEQIAEALQHAHEQGIVHRDLKPSNVMITANYDVKILDFGIGTSSSVPLPKLHGGGDLQSREVGTDVTRDGAVIGSPHYMSPEQAQGDRSVNPASDLYSLGLILQEIFTGEPAYGRNLPPTVLFYRAAGARTRPVEGLGADLTDLITRLKSATPAARPGAREVSSRLREIRQAPVRRRRRWLAAGALLLAALAGFVHMQRLRAERNQALRAERLALDAREEAESMARFVLGLFADSDPVSGSGEFLSAEQRESAKLLIDAGRRRVESDLATQPELGLRLLVEMASIYANLGFPAEAVATTEKAARWLERTPDVDTGRQFDVLLNFASDLLGAGRTEEAEREMRELIEFADRRFPGSRSSERAEARNLLAIALESMGRYSEAQILAERALELAEPGSKQWAACAGNLALVHESLGNYSEAESLHRQGLALRRALHAEQGSSYTAHELAISLNGLAQALRAQGKYRDAEAYYRESLELRRQLYGPRHPSVALVLDNLAGLLRFAGDPASAEGPFREALDIRLEVLGPTHPDVATSQNNLGLVLEDLGQAVAARDLFRRAAATYEAAFGPEHPYLGVSLTNLARASATTDPQAARPAIERALSIFRSAWPEGHWRIHYAEALRLTLQPNDASDETLRRAFEGVREALGSDSVYTRQVEGWLAEREGRAPASADGS